ncbi:MAG: hypothetical protein JNK76_06200 [Planctomycetales bacterium]|nr:hypothetical protein [Planctomycetales bacterium]MBN8625386.1 hypothetical protein [Planctomycetota bacterium]
MNRTPFALFTLLCTLASSIVAAGNASRRAGVERAVTKPAVARQATEIRQVAYIAPVETLEQPAWNAAEWKPIDVRRAYLTLIDRLPKSVQKLAPGSEQPSDAAQPNRSTADAVGKVAATVGKSNKPAAGVKAPVSNRVGASVSAPAAKKSAKTIVKAEAKSKVRAASQLPASSPLRGAAFANDAGWNWQSVVVIAGKYESLQNAWRKQYGEGAATIRIGTGTAQPAVELKQAGLPTVLQHWTPSLHVVDQGGLRFGSFYASPNQAKQAVTVPTKRGKVVEWSLYLEQVLRQIQNGRVAAIERSLDIVAARLVPSGDDRPAAVSAQLRGQTQK